MILLARGICRHFAFSAAGICTTFDDFALVCWRYTIECSYCSRRFKRMRRAQTLKPHKDSYGNPCYGRYGTIVDQEYV